MNRKKLNQKRAHIARRRAMPRCPECGAKTRFGHFIPPTIGFLNHGILAPDKPWMGGFWVCDKFYGPDGRRVAG